MPSTPSTKWTDLGRSPFLGHGGAVAATHLLAGLPDPRKPTDFQANDILDMRLSRQLKTYGIDDPPVR